MPETTTTQELYDEAIKYYENYRNMVLLNDIGQRIEISELKWDDNKDQIKNLMSNTSIKALEKDSNASNMLGKLYNKEEDILPQINETKEDYFKRLNNIEKDILFVHNKMNEKTTFETIKEYENYKKIESPTAKFKIITDPETLTEEKVKEIIEQLRNYNQDKKEEIEQENAIRHQAITAEDQKILNDKRAELVKTASIIYVIEQLDKMKTMEENIRKEKDPDKEIELLAKSRIDDGTMFLTSKEDLATIQDGMYFNEQQRIRQFIDSDVVKDYREGIINHINRADIPNDIYARIKEHYLQQTGPITVGHQSPENYPEHPEAAIQINACLRTIQMIDENKKPNSANKEKKGTNESMDDYMQRLKKTRRDAEKEYTLSYVRKNDPLAKRKEDSEILSEFYRGNKKHFENYLDEFEETNAKAQKESEKIGLTKEYLYQKISDFNNRLDEEYNQKRENKKYNPLLKRTENEKQRIISDTIQKISKEAAILDIVYDKNSPNKIEHSLQGQNILDAYKTVINELKLANIPEALNDKEYQTNELLKNGYDFDEAEQLRDRLNTQGKISNFVIKDGESIENYQNRIAKEIEKEIQIKTLNRQRATILKAIQNIEVTPESIEETRKRLIAETNDTNKKEITRTLTDEEIAIINKYDAYQAKLDQDTTQNKELQRMNDIQKKYLKSLEPIVNTLKNKLKDTQSLKTKQEKELENINGVTDKIYDTVKDQIVNTMKVNAENKNIPADKLLATTTKQLERENNLNKDIVGKVHLEMQRQLRQTQTQDLETLLQKTENALQKEQSQKLESLQKNLSNYGSNKSIDELNQEIEQKTQLIEDGKTTIKKLESQIKKENPDALNTKQVEEEKKRLNAFKETLEIYKQRKETNPDIEDEKAKKNVASVKNTIKKLEAKIKNGIKAEKENTANKKFNENLEKQIEAENLKLNANNRDVERLNAEIVRKNMNQEVIEQLKIQIEKNNTLTHNMLTRMKSYADTHNQTFVTEKDIDKVYTDIGNNITRNQILINEITKAMSNLEEGKTIENIDKKTIQEKANEKFKMEMQRNLVIRDSIINQSYKSFDETSQEYQNKIEKQFKDALSKETPEGVRIPQLPTEERINQELIDKTNAYVTDKRSKNEIKAICQSQNCNTLYEALNQKDKNAVTMVREQVNNVIKRSRYMRIRYNQKNPFSLKDKNELTQTKVNTNTQETAPIKMPVYTLEQFTKDIEAEKFTEKEAKAKMEEIIQNPKHIKLDMDTYLKETNRKDLLTPDEQWNKDKFHPELSLYNRNIKDLEEAVKDKAITKEDLEKIKKYQARMRELPQYGETINKAKDLSQSDAFDNTGSDNNIDHRNGKEVHTKGRNDINTEIMGIKQMTDIIQNPPLTTTETEAIRDILLENETVTKGFKDSFTKFKNYGKAYTFTIQNIRNQIEQQKKIIQNEHLTEKAEEYQKIVKENIYVQKERRTLLNELERAKRMLGEENIPTMKEYEVYERNKNIQPENISETERETVANVRNFIRQTGYMDKNGKISGGLTTEKMAKALDFQENEENYKRVQNTQKWIAAMEDIVNTCEKELKIKRDCFIKPDGEYKKTALNQINKTIDQEYKEIETFRLQQYMGRRMTNNEKIKYKIYLKQQAEIEKIENKEEREAKLTEHKENAPLKIDQIKEVGTNLVEEKDSRLTALIRRANAYLPDIDNNKEMKESLLTASRQLTKNLQESEKYANLANEEYQKIKTDEQIQEKVKMAQIARNRICEACLPKIIKIAEEKAQQFEKDPQEIKIEAINSLVTEVENIKITNNNAFAKKIKASRYGKFKDGTLEGYLTSLVSQDLVDWSKTTETGNKIKPQDVKRGEEIKEAKLILNRNQKDKNTGEVMYDTNQEYGLNPNMPYMEKITRIINQQRTLKRTKLINEHIKADIKKNQIMNNAGVKMSDTNEIARKKLISYNYKMQKVIDTIKPQKIEYDQNVDKQEKTIALTEKILKEIDEGTNISDIKLPEDIDNEKEKILLQAGIIKPIEESEKGKVATVLENYQFAKNQNLKPNQIKNMTNYVNTLRNNLHAYKEDKKDMVIRYNYLVSNNKISADIQKTLKEGKKTVAQIGNDNYYPLLKNLQKDYEKKLEIKNELNITPETPYNKINEKLNNYYLKHKDNQEERDQLIRVCSEIKIKKNAPGKFERMVHYMHNYSYQNIKDIIDNAASNETTEIQNINTKIENKNITSQNIRILSNINRARTNVDIQMKIEKLEAISKKQSILLTTPIIRLDKNTRPFIETQKEIQLNNKEIAEYNKTLRQLQAKIEASNITLLKGSQKNGITPESIVMELKPIKMQTIPEHDYKIKQYDNYGNVTEKTLTPKQAQELKSDFNEEYEKVKDQTNKQGQKEVKSLKQYIFKLEAEVKKATIEKSKREKPEEETKYWKNQLKDLSVEEVEEINQNIQQAKTSSMNDTIGKANYNKNSDGEEETEVQDVIENKKDSSIEEKMDQDLQISAQERKTFAMNNALQQLTQEEQEILKIYTNQAEYSTQIERTSIITGKSPKEIGEKDIKKTNEKYTQIKEKIMNHMINYTSQEVAQEMPKPLRDAINIYSNKANDGLSDKEKAAMYLDKKEKDITPKDIAIAEAKKDEAERYYKDRMNSLGYRLEGKIEINPKEEALKELDAEDKKIWDIVQNKDITPEEKVVQIQGIDIKKVTDEDIKDLAGTQKYLEKQVAEKTKVNEIASVLANMPKQMQKAYKLYNDKNNEKMTDKEKAAIYLGKKEKDITLTDVQMIQEKAKRVEDMLKRTVTDMKYDTTILEKEKLKIIKTSKKWDIHPRIKTALTPKQEEIIEKRVEDGNRVKGIKTAKEIAIEYLSRGKHTQRLDHMKSMLAEEKRKILEKTKEIQQKAQIQQNVAPSIS